MLNFTFTHHSLTKTTLLCHFVLQIPVSYMATIYRQRSVMLYQTRAKLLPFCYSLRYVSVEVSRHSFVKLSFYLLKYITTSETVDIILQPIRRLVKQHTQFEEGKFTQLRDVSTIQLWHLEKLQICDADVSRHLSFNALLAFKNHMDYFKS